MWVGLKDQVAEDRLLVPVEVVGAPKRKAEVKDR